eukprot:scaffold14784_cov123-Isochrysis_galbana.AAC.3
MFIRPHSVPSGQLQLFLHVLVRLSLGQESGGSPAHSRAHNSRLSCHALVNWGEEKEARVVRRYQDLNGLARRRCRVGLACPDVSYRIRRRRQVKLGQEERVAEGQRRRVDEQCGGGAGWLRFGPELAGDRFGSGRDLWGKADPVVMVGRLSLVRKGRHSRPGSRGRRRDGLSGE